MNRLKMMIITLAFMFFLGFNTSFAYTDNEVMEIVKKEGIMQGTNNGFEGEKNLTRAEMTTIVVNLKGLQDEKVSTSSFADVDSEHWANEYIGIAHAYGIVTGTGNGKFSPDRNVTLGEAVTMILRTVADSNEIEKSGTWPNNYMNYARREGLLKDINLNAGVVINRMQTARVLANLISSPKWEGNTEGKEDDKEESKDKVVTSVAGYGVIMSVAEGEDECTIVELATPMGLKEYIVHDSELGQGIVLPGTYIDFWLSDTRMWDIKANKVVDLNEGDKIAKVCYFSDGTVKLFKKNSLKPEVLDRNNIIFLSCDEMKLTDGLMEFEDIRLGYEMDIKVGTYEDNMLYDELDATEVFYHVIDLNDTETVVSMIYVKE